MVLVEEGRVPGEVLLEERAERFVGDAGRNEAVTSQDAPGVGVGHEDRAAHGVEQDGVGRLRPDPADRQELPPERRQGDRGHATESAAVAGPEEVHKRPQAPGFRVESAGGTDQASHSRFRQPSEPLRCQEPARPERGDRPLHVDPGRVLGEDSANRHLQVGPSRPPALGTEAGEESVVEAEQPTLDGIVR